MKGNHVEEVKEAMLVTVGEDGEEEILSMELQEVNLEVESDKQIPDL